MSLLSETEVVAELKQRRTPTGDLKMNLGSSASNEKSQISVLLNDSYSKYRCLTISEL
jgi:hypothetical protein